jgi:hypothetical protein
MYIINSINNDYSNGICNCPIIASRHQPIRIHPHHQNKNKKRTITTISDNRRKKQKINLNRLVDDTKYQSTTPNRCLFTPPSQLNETVMPLLLLLVLLLVFLSPSLSPFLFPCPSPSNTDCG